jgi:hypothetical protein
LGADELFRRLVEPQAPAVLLNCSRRDVDLGCDLLGVFALNHQFQDAIASLLRFLSRTSYVTTLYDAIAPRLAAFLALIPHFGWHDRPKLPYELWMVQNQVFHLLPDARRSEPVSRVDLLAVPFVVLAVGRVGGALDD